MDTRTESHELEAPRGRTASGVAWMGIIWYLIGAYGIAWVLWIGLRAVGVPFGIRATLGMFAPALACLLVRLLRRESFADAGLPLARRGVSSAWHLYLAAYLLPIVLVALGTGIALLLGVQHWNLPAYLHQLQTLLPGTARQTQNILAIFAATLLSAFTIGVAVTMIATFGEEFGWRGYLLPRLAPLGGVRAAILVGIIWGIWHTPVIVLDRYEYGSSSWLGVFMFVLVTIAFSILFAWLRFRSGSIWPTVLAHAVINTVGPLVFAFASPEHLYLGAPIGAIGLLPFAAVSIWLIVTGRLVPEPQAASNGL